MKAKEYLQKLQRLDTIINQKIEEIDKLKAISTSVGSFDYSIERVQTSIDNNAPYVKEINRIYDLQQEVNEEINLFVDEKHKIINQIQGLKDRKHIEVLYKRYVEFKRLEVVSVEMNFTYQYVIELHGRALKEFQITYENL